MALDSTKIIRGLENKGFVKDKKASRSPKDHRYFRYTRIRDGQEQEVFTYLSHGGKEGISNEGLVKMAKQCRLTLNQFKALIQCLLSQEDYEAYLRNNDFIR